MPILAPALLAYRLPPFLLVGGHAGDRGDPEKLTSEERLRASPAARRVLIVEDEFFVAVQIEAALQSSGYETVGPFTTLGIALQASRQERFDVALIDINLGGTPGYPIADDLLARGVPFLFLTGYSGNDLPEIYRPLPRLQKPFDPKAVVAALEQVLKGELG
jgi:DNA-binding response OmpR family regulator